MPPDIRFRRLCEKSRLTISEIAKNSKNNPECNQQNEVFSKVTKTYAIRKHDNHWETIWALEIFYRFRDFLLDEDLDFRRDAFSSYKE
jgi:hypothetical protein